MVLDVSDIPRGFPPHVIEQFETRIRRKSIGNVVASGTAVITSSVPSTWRRAFRSSTPPPTASSRSPRTKASSPGRSFEWCEAVYDICVMAGPGRVIARPFIGLPGSFQRTPNRHDTMPPTAETLLDRLVVNGHRVTSVGKSRSVRRRGISASHLTKSDADGIDKIEALMATEERGMISRTWSTSTPGTASQRHGRIRRESERFDVRPPAPAEIRTDDLRDHCRSRQRSDHASTDHSREHVPVLLKGEGVKAGVDLARANVRRSWQTRPRTLIERLLTERASCGDNERRMTASIREQLEQREREILRRRRPRAPTARAVSARRPRTRFARRSSATAIASSIRRRFAA